MSGNTTSIAALIFSNANIANMISELPIYIFLTILVILILRYLNSLSVKIGDKEINLSSKNFNQIKPIIKVVIDYADWKSELGRVSRESIELVNKDAKKITRINLDTHISILSARYTDILNRSTEPTKKLITSSFIRSFYEIIRHELLGELMTIYEVNHLHNKTDEELKELTDKHYLEIQNTYVRIGRNYWYNELLPIDDLFNACTICKTEFWNLLYKLMQDYRNFSKKKFALETQYTELDGVIRDQVIEDGKLPSNAYIKLGKIYKEIQF